MGGASLRFRLLATVLALLAMLGTLASASRGRVDRARPTAGGCADPDALPAARDRSNPLALPAPPGPNPLTGARLFVNGPAHGAAARAIATLVGLDPRLLPDDESWASFLGLLERGPLAARLASDPALATQVRLLAKIASQPETNRFSRYSGGGGAGAI